MLSTAPLTRAALSYESFALMGVRITPKVLGHETNGQFSMVEAAVEPGAGSPPHIGRNETKIFYVVSGEFEFLVGNLTRRGAAGDTLVIPAGAIHNFTNVGSEPGTLLVTFTPAGHEHFLWEVSRLFQNESVLPEELEAVCRAYGVEML